MEDKSKLSAPVGYWLGCDFGTNNIGFAIGQKFTKTASPIKVVKAKEGVPNNWKEIDDIIERWRPKGIILGLPLNDDQSENIMSKKARDFGKTLEQRTSLPITFVNEHLSSKSIKDDIKNRLQNTQVTNQRSTVSKSKRAKAKNRIDALSACLILETWLNL